MKSEVQSSWTEYETELMCRCGEQQQSYRECKSGKNYVNQFWCNSNDMSPFKLNQCEQCQQLDDYAYNDNYYIVEDSSDYSDYSSSSYSSSTSDSSSAYDVSMTQFLVLFIFDKPKRRKRDNDQCSFTSFDVDYAEYCPCEIPKKHRPQNCHVPCHSFEMDDYLDVATNISLPGWVQPISAF